jgi:hypothetical protein
MIAGTKKYNPAAKSGCISKGCRHTNVTDIGRKPSLP